MDSRLLRRDLEKEVRQVRAQRRAAIAEGEALEGAGAAECRGEARALREVDTRLGALLARAEQGEHR